MSKVLIDETTLTGIGDAIRSKEGTTELIPPLEMKPRIEALGGGGCRALEEHATMIRFTSLNILGEKTATINLYEATTLRELFNISKTENVNTVVEHLTINCPNAVAALNNCVNGYMDKTLKKITLNVDTSAATSASYAFSSNYVLEEVDGTPLDFTSVTSSGNLVNPFNVCHELREVRCKGLINVSISFSYTKKLSKASVLSIESCLSDAATGMTLTLPLEAVDTAFETSEGAADGSTSEEWLEIVESKPNWTFSLK